MRTSCSARIPSGSPWRTASASGSRLCGCALTVGDRCHGGERDGEQELQHRNQDVVWMGGSLIRIVEPGAWHGVDVEFVADGRFDGRYVNF